MPTMPHHENDEFERIQARIELRARQRQRAARIAKLQLIQHELDEMNARRKYRSKKLLDGVALGAVMALFVAAAILFTLA